MHNAEQLASWKKYAIYGLSLMTISIVILLLNPAFTEVLDTSYLINLQNLPVLIVVAFAVFIVPIIEELSFRLWLKPKFYWFIILGIAFVSVILKIHYGLVLLIICVVIALMYKFNVKEILTKRNKIAVILSSLFFGLIHLLNFNSLNTAHFILAAYLTGFGLFLAAIRLRYGIILSICIHVVYNFVVIFREIPDLSSNSSFSENGGVELIERGFFDGNTITSKEEKIFVCIDCTKRSLIRSVLKISKTENFLVKDEDLRSSFKKYDLWYDPSKNIQDTVILTFILDELNLSLNTSEEEVEVLSIVDSSKTSIVSKENIKYEELKGLKLSEKAVIGLDALASLLSEIYSIKVVVDNDSDNYNIYKIDEGISLKQNLNNLRSKNSKLHYSYSVESSNVVTLKDK